MLSQSLPKIALSKSAANIDLKPKLTKDSKTPDNRKLIE